MFKKVAGKRPILQRFVLDTKELIGHLDSPDIGKWK